MPDETGSNDLYLSDVSPQDKPWDVHRTNAAAVQSLYEQTDLRRYAVRIRECSKALGFAFQSNDAGELKLRLQQCKCCRVRHCPVCQWRRCLMWRARFFQTVPKVMEVYPKHRWVFLTFTVRNPPLNELRDTLGLMNKAWNRMILRKKFPAIGFVKATEVTRAENGYAHPHFHVLMLVSSRYFGDQYIKQEEWRVLWQQALRVDYLPVVNVKAVKPRQGKEGNGFAIALLETMKYGVKESDLLHDAAWLSELTKQLHKTRAVSVGGVLKDYLSEEEPDDLVHAEDEEPAEGDSEIRVWFGWREMAKRYVKTD